MRKWKKIIAVIGSAVILGSIAVFGLTSCMAQSLTKSYGGSMTVNLPANQKLEEITWKDDSLWYLTKPMTEEDIAEVHTFQQSTNFGIFEGTVTIIETKE